MIFFQPKIEHKDKGFLFRLNKHLAECDTEPGYEGKGVIYMLDVTYKGVADYVAYVKPDGEPFLFRTDNDLTLKASEALYKKMSEASVKKDDHVEIMLTNWTDPKGTKKTVWNVVIYDAATVPKVVNNVQNDSKSINIPISSGTLGITWGMCMNNATKIVIDKYNVGDAEGNGGVAEFVETIEMYARPLMDVAVNGLKRWEQDHYQKDQNDEPMIEEETKLDDDDLPF